MMGNATKETFSQYVLNLYHNVPTGIYEGLLAIFCVGSVLVIAIYGWDKGWRKVTGLLLAEYVFLLFCSTVICRTTSESVGHNFNPFWSYEAIQNGRSELLVENIMNVVVFILVGILLGLVIQKPQKGLWRTRMRRIALIIGTGLIISVTIVGMQYMFHRGFAEVVDVMHNTIGCIIGYILVHGSRFMVKGKKCRIY